MLQVAEQFYHRYVLQFGMEDEEGQGVVEYGLLLGLLVIGAIAIIVLLGPKITSMWTNINGAVPNNVGGSGT
jgi:pilus assembly protein Flp/PilA